MISQAPLSRNRVFAATAVLALVVLFATGLTAFGQGTTITSADNTTFTAGTAGTFTVTTSGFLVPPTITESGALPGGVFLTDNGGGTATISGTPASGSGGSYPITITASNGIQPAATQNFVLTIDEAPAITSANGTAFTTTQAGTFLVTSSGFPAAALAESGALPTNVTFSDNGNGTATLAGTPPAGTGGTYPITITASNGVGSSATQNFVLTINQAPAITSANGTAFTTTQAGTFLVTSSGFPAAALAESGALPTNVTFSDNGNGTATLAGTPAAGTGGTYPITITASNGVGSSATQNFVLTVNQAPAITSANSTTFTTTQAGTFLVTSSGFPTAALSESGALPTNVTFTDNANGTATLAGTPPAGTGGQYPITITASNGVGSSATQNFVLTINQAPAITSANGTTFAITQAGTFLVTSSGFPAAALAKSGALPTNVTFSDNGNGTATLAGTPAAGTGGTYPITITASNGVGSSATQNFVLTINQPPVVNAGPAQTITLPAGATLNGSATDDGFPNPPGALTYNWAMVTGPGVVTFANAHSASTTATFSIAGSYTLRLTANDSQLSGSADVVVTVGGPLPSPWVDQDVGAVGVSGGASYVPGPCTFIQSGSGADIWGTADAFHYVYQPLNGDGKIVARIATQQNTDPQAKAGVMIRETLAPGAANAAVVVMPTSGVQFQRRVSTNGTSVNNRATGAGIVAPYWVKLYRQGNVFSAYHSVDGSTWKSIGTATIPMSTNVLIGLAVTSHNNTVGSQATFDHVNLSPTVNAGPAQSITLPTNKVTLSGSATDDGYPSPPSLTYSWSKVSGPSGGNVNFGTPSLPSTTAKFAVAGVYTLRLTANDSQLTGTGDVVITVNSSSSPTPTPTPTATPTPTTTPTPTPTPTVTPTPTPTATPTPTVTPTPTPTATPSPTPIRINCGGPAYSDSLGQDWSADIDFVGGSKATYTATVSGTSDPKLYQSERYGKTVKYNIPVANGNYEVTLDFSENYWNAAGKRVFNVAIEGQTVLQNFDIWALTGQNSALQRTFVVAITNGMLNIVGTASVDSAKFSAIQVIPKTGDLYLHPVLSLPKYIVHYAFDNGPTTVSLIGDLSHTHQLGHHLTSWTWTEGAAVLGTQADVIAPFALGRHTVTLTIGDDNSPPRTASDSGTFTVYPINAVGGLLTSYYFTNGTPPSQVIDSLQPQPNCEEVLLTAEIEDLAGNISGSPFTSNVVAVMDGKLNVPTAATYQFTLTGGSATRFYLNGNLVSGAMSLQPGTYTIEARFAVDSASLLPAQILASINGAPAVILDPSTLSHDESNLLPFINSMPTTGSPLGGDAVTISGIGFFPTPSVTVLWDGTTLSGSSLTITPYSIQFTTPPGNGTINVTVQTPNGTSNSYSFTYVQGQVPINFTAAAAVANVTSPTQSAWGPDGRLYVGSATGNITIYTFADDYTVTNTQVVTTIAGLSNKSILGIAFNPLDPPNPVKIYVSHSHLYAEGGGSFTGPAPYNGQVSVLTGPDFSSVQPLITGLPVSNRDHAINQMTFDNTGDLLICVGSETNAGIPSVPMGTLPNSPLDAAILKARITKPDFNGTITYIETATGNPNNDQVYGDKVDVAPGVDVSVYIPGTRNPFDIVWTTLGKLYGSDNGMNANFGDVSTSATTQVPPSNVSDRINYLVDGHYYGSPSRNRGRYDDRQNVYHFPTDPEIFGTYNGSPMGTILSSSDGIDEYRATTFNSAMRGNLLVQHWNSVLYRGVLSPDGRSLQSLTTIANALGLSVVTGPGGAILSPDYSNNRLLVMKPLDAGAPAMVAYDIFPWRARADGSAPFTIGGAGFSGLANTTVTVGGVAANLTSVSPARITGFIPANSSPSPQLLDVVVQSAGSTSTIPQAFRYMQGTSAGMGSWQNGPALPAGIGEVAGAVVNGVLYIVSGDVSATLAYDLKSGVWRSDIAARPLVGQLHSAEVINSKLYLFGGLGGGSEGAVQIYNPNTNSWGVGAAAPYAAGSVSTTVINGKVYMAGGIVGGATVSTAAVYNPATNTWSSISSMPAGRNHAAAGTDGTQFFVFGGRTGGNTVSNGFNDVQIYNPSTDSWQWSGQSGSTIPPLPQARGGMGKAPFYCNEFYVMGGETTASGTGQVAGNVYNRVDVYNPISQTWRLEATMPTALHGISPVVADGKIFVAGGGVQAGQSTSTIFRIFLR